MIEIIRIGNKFKKPISRLDNNDKAYILDWIFCLALGEKYEIKDTVAGDLLELIQYENAKMSEKADKWKSGWKLWWRPKKTLRDNPMGKPLGKPKEKEKEKEKDKDKEKVKEKVKGEKTPPKISSISTKEEVNILGDDFTIVKITQTQMDSLLKDFDEEVIMSSLEDVENYCCGHWKKYKDYSKATRNFLKKDWVKKKPKSKEEMTKKIRAMIQVVADKFSLPVAEVEHCVSTWAVWMKRKDVFEIVEEIDKIRKVLTDREKLFPN